MKKRKKFNARRREVAESFNGTPPRANAVATYEEGGDRAAGTSSASTQDPNPSQGKTWGYINEPPQPGKRGGDRRAHPRGRERGGAYLLQAHPDDDDDWSSHGIASPQHCGEHASLRGCVSCYLGIRAPEMARLGSNV